MLAKEKVQLALFVVLIAFFPRYTLGADQQFLSIGTGGVTGVYYPTGSAICRLVNKGRKEHGVRCSVESTGGSIYNINTIRGGEFEFGVVQSDWQYHAYNGTVKKSFIDAGPYKELRAVFSVYPEPYTVLASPGIIQTCPACGDGKCRCSDSCDCKESCCESRPLQGLDPAKLLGYTKYKGKFNATMKFEDQLDALCSRKSINIAAFATGHPSALTREALSTCDLNILELSGSSIDEVVKNTPYLRHATIPVGMYGNNREIKTFGVGATLVTRSDVSDETVYKLVKSVFDNFDEFKTLHPAFANLQEKEMIKDSLTAPLHNGAARYYKERGWM